MCGVFAYSLAADLRMSRACYLLLQTVACWWVTLGVAQKYLHLAAKTWWISGTPQRNVWYLSQSRQWIEVTKLRESLKGRFHPLKGTGYGFIFKPFAFKVLHPADLSFRISVSLVQFIFLKKRTKKRQTRTNTRDAELLLWFCSHFKEKIQKVMSLSVGWLWASHQSAEVYLSDSLEKQSQNCTFLSVSKKDLISGGSKSGQYPSFCMCL